MDYLYLHSVYICNNMSDKLIVEYLVLSESSPFELSDSVNEYLRQGYKLYKGVAVSVTNSTSSNRTIYVYAQVVVRYEGDKLLS